MSLIFFLAASLIPPCSLATTNSTVASTAAMNTTMTSVAAMNTTTTTSVAAMNTTTMTSVGICPNDCDIGNGPQTCDEIVSQDTDSSCDQLELLGCICDGLVNNTNANDHYLSLQHVLHRHFISICNFAVVQNAVERQRRIQATNRHRSRLLLPPLSNRPYSLIGFLWCKVTFTLKIRGPRCQVSTYLPLS